MSALRRRPVGLVLGSLVALIALAAGVRALVGPSDPSPGASRLDAFRAARDGVCAAADRARAGDQAGARTVFFDRAHQGLHELAAAAQDADRAAAARLLEAKATVEGGLERGAPSLAVDVDTLAAATGAAMVAAGGADPGPCRP